MISVVIPTFNRADALARTIDSFFAQHDLDRIRHELLIIDNNSPDHTGDVVRARMAQGRPLRLIRETQQGLCFARNRGIAESIGEVVAFLDDDVLLDADWLRHLAERFDDGADVVGGRALLHWEQPPPPWLVSWLQNLLSRVDLGPDPIVAPDPHRLAGLNLAFRRTVLERIGGFRVDLDRSGTQLLGGGDTQAVLDAAAAGARVVYAPDVLVHHVVPTERTRWEYFKRIAEAKGPTIAAMEGPASTIGQLRRVAASLVSLLVVAVRYLKRLATRADAGQFRIIAFTWRQEWSLLRARWQRLLGREGARR